MPKAIPVQDKSQSQALTERSVPDKKKHDQKLGMVGVSQAIQKRRMLSKEALRESLQGHNYLRDINRDLNRHISDEELPVVKFKTETRLRLLSKIIPDLKAIEHTGEDGAPLELQHVVRALTDKELADAISIASKLADARGFGPVTIDVRAEETED